MPDPDRTLTALGRLAERPPAPTPPVAEIIDAARRRRRTRRRIGQAVAAMLLAGTAVAAAVASAGDGTGRFATADRDRGTVAPATERPGGSDTLPLVVEPRTGLADGDTVTLTVREDPGGELVAHQCASEALDPGRGGEAWCARTEHYLRSPAGSPGLELPVSRTLTTSRGPVDCAERPGRCVVLVRSTASGRHGARWSGGLSFRAAPLASGAPHLEVDGRARNGGAVTVTGSGYPAGDELLVRQCLGADASAPCDQARVAAATVARDGSFEAPFVVSEEALTDDGWTRCEPCFLQTMGNLSPATSSEALDVVARGEPVRPTVSIVDAPPHVPGQRVTLEGSGFQAGAAGITIGSCALPRGDTPADCTYPQAGFPAATPTVDGTLRIEGYPLPGAGHPCTAAGARCALAWYPNDGGPAAFVTELDLGRP